jgi:hypothetical protein
LIEVHSDAMTSASAKSAKSERSSFTEFWLHYLQSHAHPGTRALHYVGTVTACVGILSGLITLNPWFAVAGIASAYALAWLGHSVIERNRPCVLRHPLWSLFGDLRMLGLWFSGRLNAQLKRAGVPTAES